MYFMDWDKVDGGFVDADPDFRRVLDFVNDTLRVRTIGSCAGYLPGDKYVTVQEVMKPYVQFSRDSLRWRRAADLFRACPFLDSSRRTAPSTVALLPSLIGRWGELLEWLQIHHQDTL